jgi:hypothetical protein
VSATKFRIIGGCVNLRVGLGALVVKNGAGKLVAFTKPANLPNIADGALQAIGSCYFGNLDIAGAAVTKNSTQIYFFNSTSMADNQSIASSTIDATYRF